MTKLRRRSNRGNAQDSPEPLAEEGSTASLEREVVEGQAEEEKCPACVDDKSRDPKVADKENWVRCDACRTWYHWRCVGEGDLEAIAKWYCKSCHEADPKRINTLKPPVRKSSRKRQQRDYAGMHSGNEQDSNRWMRMMEGKTIQADPFKRMSGSEVTVEWLESEESAMREPIVVENSEGLGMKMPPPDFTVRQVAEIMGEDTPVEVIDVATQSNIAGWTLGKWTEYYETELAQRDKIRNVISLEISGTELADKVLPPRLVREIDWVEKFWPTAKRGRGHAYPKVQLYCLMGVADAWTDWHVDFAGSSVYYHILHGEKVFYFIRPTSANLAAYERWSGTDMQNHSWLGDMVDEVYKVELRTGNTMIIPTGWIHAVYTPVDTLVFGGNFLHSYNVATQLRIREIEIATHVPKKFRFPHFVKLCWYAAEKYLRDLKAKEEFSQRVMDSVEALAEFLVSEARTMERGSDHGKKEAKESVPADRIKDAPSLARELRWRVRLAMGYNSDDDMKSRKKSKPSLEATHSANKKRKRGEEETVLEMEHKYLHFKPRSWDIVSAGPSEHTSQRRKIHRPSDTDDWKTQWSTWQDSEDTASAEEATLETRKDTIVKLRRTERCVERQRVERVLEVWTWDGADTEPTTEDGKAELPISDDKEPIVESSIVNTVELDKMDTDSGVVEAK